MYKNLNAESLGVSGRQSELIELALTYGVKGFDIDIPVFCKQAQLRGEEHAGRFIQSAAIKIGPLQLPVDWQVPDETFHEYLSELEVIAKTASAVGVTGCHTVVMAGSDELPYHQNFEFHRRRFTEIADTLAPHSIQLGLDFQATKQERDGFRHSFIHTPDALITLAKTVGVANVGVTIDIWKWHVSGGNIEQLREVNVDDIVVVRLADVPSVSDLESVDVDQRVLPGAGEGSCVSAIEILEELGYKGPVTPYAHASQLNGGTRDVIVREAAESIDKVRLAGQPSEEEVAQESLGEELVAASTGEDA